MGPYLARRLAQSLLVLVLVSITIFVIIHVAPGGPAILVASDLSPADRQYIMRNLGLDRPVGVQLLKWFGAVARGDFGRSLNNQRPVIDLIRERLPATLVLASAALALAIGAGVPLGVAAARRPASWVDHAATGLSVFGVAVPSFWLGIMMILTLSVRWRVLPSAGMTTVGAAPSPTDLARHLVMPAIVLALFYLAQIASYSRSSMLDVLHRDYVRTARAKGAGERVVLFRHALRNAMIPVVTVVGLLMPRLVGGAAITETIFSWPGLGRLAVEAAFKRDYPLIMGITVVFAVAVVLSNLLVDIAYAALDPRVKVGAGEDA
ncbi:MAG TPA: ABC transporter permease [bacterium]|nr:ABC transporter permease [bacterium]